MALGDVSINVSAMYLEIARALSTPSIEINTHKTGFINPNELPNNTKCNIHFAYTSVAIIMGLASIEAYINGIAKSILIGHYDNLYRSNFVSKDKYEQRLKSIKSFKQHYSNDESKEKFYKSYKLTKKLNLIFDALNQQRLFERKEKGYRKIWENLVQLEKIRHELIHAKGDALEQEVLDILLHKEPEEIKEMINRIASIKVILHEGFPTTNVNASENVVLGSVKLPYLDMKMQEHLMLTGTLYTHENVKEWGSRWIE